MENQVVEAIMLHQKLNKKQSAKDLTIKLFEEVQLPDPERILVLILIKFLGDKNKEL